MSVSRPTLLLACLALTVSCGLLAQEQDLPPLAAVEAARAGERSAWERLDEAYRGVQEDPIRGLAALRASVERFPEDVRLAIYLQDVELELDPRDLVRRRANSAFREERTGLHALLAARVQEDPEQRYRLLGVAVDLDPELTQAWVARIWMEARAGEPEVLDRLIGLLRDDPGSAEAWRMLADLAPLYARPDLARAAVQTEPWSFEESSLRADYTLAVADLSAGNTQEALREARALPPDMWEGRLLEAAALAQLDNPEEALAVVEEVLTNHPDLPEALFNKGLLLRDYLGRNDEAIPVFQRFLEVSKETGNSNLLRVTQAQLWLGMEVES